MTEVPTTRDVERFRASIAQRLGLWFDDSKLDQLAGVLDRRLRVANDPAGRYLAKLEGRASAEQELRAIAQELTVGETYFFRHNDQFRAFYEVALPERTQARASTRQLCLLSAGCSSGEEAYTLSILTRTYLAEPGWEVTIRGVDVNPTAVERARRARYSQWALRETPDDMRDRYFVADGSEFVLAKAIRESVVFEEGNLTADDSWLPESFDVIFCRNVLMYFTPEQMQRVVTRFARALAPGGFLFMGHAENLRGVSQAFDLCHTHGTFYYRRKGALRLPSHVASANALPAAPAPRASSALDWTSTWLETVQRSSDRIRSLTETPSPKPLAAANTAVRLPSRPAGPARVDLTLALELLSHERFAEALDVLAKLPNTSASDPDVVLLRAALLTNCDRLDAAEQACAELLALDGLNAGAHYLRSLCRERQGDTRAATEHAQIACYLDASFAMPRLHLGLLARRLGDRATAQHELSQAALLLQREEASRLLLFGGGFSREGLITLCRSELERLGVLV